MDTDWKEEIIQKRLGGKKDWTDEERKVLCEQLDQDLEKHLNSFKKSEKEDVWTEENWKEKMSEHPIFTPFLQEEGVTDIEAPINALSEGLAQLKYDPEYNSPAEVAQSYKEEGIIHFKYKKYRFAIASFSEGLKQQDCSDKKLVAQLYNNRAAAHARIGNNRSALNDCQSAVVLDPTYTKAMIKAIECCKALEFWQQAIEWCDKTLLINAQSEQLTKTKSECVVRKKESDRDARKAMAKQKHEDASNAQLLSAIKDRKLNIMASNRISQFKFSLSDLQPIHPMAQGACVHLNKADELEWPVIFLYPEFKEMDFISAFNENDCLSDHFSVIFNDLNPAPWDAKHEYCNAHQLTAFYESKEESEMLKLVEVNKVKPLKDVIQNSLYTIKTGTPAFYVLSNKSVYLKEFLSLYKNKIML